MINGSDTPKEERDCARTPDWLFRWCDKYLGPYDVDLAASKENAKCRRFYSGKRGNDALIRGWADDYPGGHGFLNPPYSDLSPWMAKAAEEAANAFCTTMVIPCFNGEGWNEWYAHAELVINIIGRVNFWRPDGTEMKGNPRGTCIALFAPRIPLVVRGMFELGEYDVGRVVYIQRDDMRLEIS